MQVEVILTIAVTILSLVVLGVPVLICGAIGCFGKIGQVLTASWLTGMLLLVTTTFSETHQDSSKAPTFELRGWLQASPA
jgi:maltodextrin utilization protein YvdJ